MTTTVANVDPFLAHLMGGSATQPVSQSPAPEPQVQQEATVVAREEVSVVPMANDRHLYVGKPDSEWEWRDLQDYVVDQIEAIHGPFVRDNKQEYGIFNAFVGRWGKQSAAIARYAFEECGGYWVNAPVTITRFTKGNDPFFAAVISQRLS